MTNYDIKYLRKRYEQAVKDKEESFKILDYEFLTGYAKYLLQYLEMRKIDEKTPLQAILVKT